MDWPTLQDRERLEQAFDLITVEAKMGKGWEIVYERRGMIRSAVWGDAMVTMGDYAEQYSVRVTIERAS